MIAIRYVAMAALAITGVIGAGVFVSAVRAETAPLPVGQAKYYEGCGGCHGLNGVSAREQIPVLRSQVGLFLCSDEGRRYIVQLPNVSFAAMDDATLAATMNFVVFKLGGNSVPEGARPYSAKEIGVLRKTPLKNQPLVMLREQVLGRAAGACARGDVSTTERN